MDELVRLFRSGGEMRYTELMEISEVRAIFSRVVREQPTPNDRIQAARETLQLMCQEAAEYGLTTADVVSALFRPALEKRRTCNCPTCKGHRDELEEEALRGKNIPVM